MINNNLLQKHQIPFFARTVQTISDFSIDEQLYLYNLSSKIKHAVHNKDYKYLDSISINNNNYSVNLLFQENSTRTKESFYNAAQFHKIRVRDIPLSLSSIQKNETFTDTVKTIIGYAEQSSFIIRSTMEGLCRWLHHTILDFAQQHNLTKPFFINAGDGRNDHPTQELLDQFTFYEHLNKKTSHIHIALIGDLFHGRTVHSKCYGLKIFKEVKVDLIAPQELAMPAFYVDQMKNAGFEVTLYESIEEYISQSNIANIWYFTRLQIERLSDTLLPQIDNIVKKITYYPDLAYETVNNSIENTIESLQKSKINILPKHIKFFHPLPRDKMYPIIPYSLDNTSLNGWDMQSINGYYLRIALLAMLNGKVGTDFNGTPLQNNTNLDEEFIIDIKINKDKVNNKPIQKIGIKPVENGIVIDHIAKGQNTNQIWNRIDTIRRIMNFNTISSHGVYKSYKNNIYKGIISLPNFELVSQKDFKKLGAISPGCTINIIKNSIVIRKMAINQPPRIYNFSALSCKNPYCVSHKDQKEHAFAEFFRNEQEYICHYCKTPHDVNEIWNRLKI